MRRIARRRNTAFIRAALALLVFLLAVYIPLKIHIARSGAQRVAAAGDISFSLFVTSDLAGFREPCG